MFHASKGIYFHIDKSTLIEAPPGDFGAKGQFRNQLWQKIETSYAVTGV